MKSFLLAIAAVQILHCSGLPSTKDALRASVAKLNEITKITNLCAITRRGVTNTYRTGKLSHNVYLTFSVKETVCSKNTGQEFDDPICTFRPKNIAEKGFCKSHVEYFADKVADVDVECEGLKTIDSESDSAESNETSIEAQSKSNETSLEETSSVESKSEETSLEESSNVESKSEETSLEDSSNDKSKSTETSLEDPDNVKDKSKEASIEESSNMKSKSTELSQEESSNEGMRSQKEDTNHE
ncbi:secreted phosphoprotein 24-like isoform X1 [Amblyraja radiata]|uniref:secreted phosphoprotein 24-like isoform X1 n=1 Tax=Amblyraja radiata TaxID=386614 RepID=UPI001401D058|nr:secreted phosphoprotein 24-like isoform X1 [Amblyraja radiata]